MTTSRSVVPGDVIEFIEQKKVLCAICLEVVNKRIRILTETDRVMSLGFDRILNSAKKNLDPDAKNKAIVSSLKLISNYRKNAADKLDLKSYWEKLSECYDKTLPPSDLIEKIQETGSDIPETDQEPILLRAVIRNKIYMKYTKKMVHINSQDDVKKILDKREAERLEKMRMTNLSNWLEQKLLSSGNHDNDIKPEDYHRLIRALEADAADLHDQPDRGWLKKIREKIKISPQLSSFKILVKLGVYSKNQNLFLVKYGFPIKFSSETNSELSYLDPYYEISRDQRLDLTNLDCFTIDGPDTSDMDDAISYEKLDHGCIRIGIHITDVSSWIQPGSFLDEDARERAQTLYLPEKIWHMFPDDFAEKMASLRMNTELPVISFLVEFDQNHELQNYKIQCAIINVKEKLSYSDVDSRINSSPFQSLLQLAQKLRQDRIENGAILMPRPEVTIDAQDPGKLIFKKRLRQSKSQIIVSECMILANRLAAETASDSDVCFPFRTQKKPKESVPRSDYEFNPYISYCQRRMMPRAENSLKARPHFSLGVNAYTNVTSPLRRYFDILAQRQLKAILGYDDPYDEEELQELIKELESSTSRSSAVIWNTNKFWLMKYLTAFKGKAVDAVVLDRFPNRYQIWLNDICMDADLPLSFGQTLHPDQKIRVIVEKVSPQNATLKLRLSS